MSTPEEKAAAKTMAEVVVYCMDTLKEIVNSSLKDASVCKISIDIQEESGKIHTVAKGY